MRNQLTGIALAVSILTLPAPAMAGAMGDELQPMNPSYSAYSTSQTAGQQQQQQSEAIPLRGRVSTIPKGTSMIVKLDQPLSSFSSSLGQNINATLENDVFVNDRVMIPAGSEVTGQVTDISRSGRLGKHGELDVRFYSVRTPDGTTIPIQGYINTQDNTGVLKGDSYKKDIAKGVGVAAAGTGIGAVSGTALGGLLGVAGTGAVMGTALGGLAGIGYALARRGKDVVIPSGARLNVKVSEDVNVDR